MSNKSSKIVVYCFFVVLQAAISPAQPVTTIAIGSQSAHSLFLKSGGSLWAMGDNNFGQLGDGTYNQTNFPEQIMSSNVTAIAAGALHSLFLKSDGSLWAMGDDNCGQLGDGNGAFSAYTNRPEQIVSSNVVAIAAGSIHSLFLKSDGTYNNTNLPEQIVASGVVAIAAGGLHSLFLKSDGSLWAMGNGTDGQLGNGTNSTQIGLFYSTNQPVQIVSSNVTAIAAGGSHSLFLKSDGSLWAMGDDYYGQLGDGKAGPNILTFLDIQTNLPEQIMASNVTAIAAGYMHSLFLQSDGSLWAMGYGQFGQLGNGTTTDSQGRYWDTNDVPEQIVATGVTAIAAGAKHSLFLKSDGSLWAMGDNTFGQLGDGTTNNVNRPEQILAAYNQITSQLSSSGDMHLFFVGIAGANYALDRSFSLSPANWMPLATNPANSFGALVLTNTPDSTTNNFWRIRSVP